jgi:hypothetical protein
MTGRWAVNLLLALVLLGLGLLIRDELARAERQQTLAGIAAADVRLLVVERAGEPTVRIERTPDGWRMLEPLRLDADPGLIARLLAVVDAPVARSFPAQGPALAELGLAPGRLTLKLDTLELVFGGLDPLGQRRYVETDGLVHLIDDRFHHLLIAPPIDYVAKTPLPASRPPAFATLSGVPLDASSLAALSGVTAERVEALTGELAGEALEVKYADGSAVRFLVSEDRRRWSRLDLKLRYVVADPPELELDPTRIDPTPPEPPPPPVEPRETAPAALPIPTEAIPTDDLATGGFGEAPYYDDPMPEVPLAPPPEPDPADPFAPIPEVDLMPMDSGGMPEVRLSPDAPDGDEDPGYEDRGYDDGGYGDADYEQGVPGGLRGEPHKEPPQGFGMDPFAPDPPDDN